MKRAFSMHCLVALVLTLSSAAGAQMGGMAGGQHVMGYPQQQAPPRNRPESFGPGCGLHPGMMHCGMMGYGWGMMPPMRGWGMGPVMMGRGCGMMPPGMMGWPVPGGQGGRGYRGFPGQGPCGPAPWAAGTADIQENEEFFGKTKDLRRDLHMKMFDYKEAQRNGDAEEVQKLGPQIEELQKRIRNTWSGGK